MLSQKESVFQAVTSIVDCTQDGVVVELTKEQRATVISLVTQSIMQNETELKANARAKYVTEADVKGYVSGMVSNWLRKDTRLNGGNKYEIKNPGSRAGQGDELLSNLKSYRATFTDPVHIAAVDKEIEARKAQLAITKPTAAKKLKAINFDILPESLQSLRAEFGE